MRKVWSLLAVGIVVLAIAGPAAWAGAANVSFDPGRVQWDVQAEHEGAVLTVSMPGGEVVRKEFDARETPVFDLAALKGAKDGAYTYELRLVPRIDASLRNALAEARKSGDEAAIAKLRAELPESPVVSGGFMVQAGVIVLNEGKEPTRDKGKQAAAAGSVKNVTAQDQVIPDDLIVQGSECVGLDCVNNENFGFDTIRMKENNLRIHFDDTSTQAGFPANDWRLIANDSASGGSSKFSIEDSTSSKTPFTVTAGASTNSIFVDSTGRVGFRTSTPVLDLHVNTSNTPALRLEQNNSGGFTAQTWDIGANEANFFVRDVTGGSKLSLRIRPGAPTSSLDISADGDVGVGTASPSEKLHVLESDDTATLVLVQNTSSGTSAAGLFQAKNNGNAVTSVIAHGSAQSGSRFGTTINNKSELLSAGGDGLLIGTLEADSVILGTNSTARVTIGASGGVTVNGDFTVTGGTKNFAVVDPEDSSRAIYYAALEGPEAGTYYRGTARTKDGEVVIELPGYFTRITESERMTVQLTPVGGWGQLYVAEKTPQRLVVRVAPGTADQEFDYMVQGVRKGYLNFEVERTNNLPNQ